MTTSEVAIEGVKQALRMRPVDQPHQAYAAVMLALMTKAREAGLEQAVQFLSDVKGGRV